MGTCWLGRAGIRAHPRYPSHAELMHTALIDAIDVHDSEPRDYYNEAVVMLNGMVLC